MMGHSAFGTELRSRRQAAGYSLSQFAELIHYSKGHLSKIESGDKPANASLARLCDASLGAGGELVALAPHCASATRDGEDEATGSDAPDTGGSWGLRLGADGTGSFVLLAADDVPAEDVFASGLSFASDRSPVDTSAMVDHFDVRFDMARTLAQQMSPLALLPLLIAETHMVRGLATKSGSADAVALWRKAARYAEFVGWMAQEAGHQQHAWWWTQAAVRMSDRAGDGDLRPYALVRRAEVTLHEDDGRQTVELARRALTYPSASARVRALAHHRQAQGHALLGEEEDCLRSLGASVDLLAEAGDTTATALALGTIKTPDLTSMIRGWCLFDLGRPVEAAALLEVGLAGFAASSSRARGRYGARTALAQAVAGELDRACEIVEALAPDLRRIDSETVRHDLRLLNREFRRRPGVPRVRDVLPLFNDLLRGPDAHRV
jgi:transcriptional regulator with XRE-family HTH domain